MNGITHKQAIQWIDRRLDGLLNDRQIMTLDKHLRSCDSCSAYAADMDGLSVRVKNGLHRRWNDKSGPSQDVLEYVTAKASRIPLTNRLASGLKLTSGLITLIALAVFMSLMISQLQDASPATVGGEIATSSPWVEDRLLAFASDQTGNSDIYTVRADGSRLTNLTDHPAHDSNPIWSLDAKRIVFDSGRDGFQQIYSMKADGSDVIQLTHGDSHHYLPMNIHGETNPWSPDGTKLLFLQRNSGFEAANLYSLDTNSGATVMLASGNVQFNNLSWSPNGSYIGYVLNDSPTPDATFTPGIYIINALGGTPIAISELLPATDSINSPSYYWSRDGNSIVFIAHRTLEGATDQWIAYEAVLESQQLIERATSSMIMESWWDETSFVISYGTDLYTLMWLRADGTSSAFKPFERCDLTLEADHGFLTRRSPNGSQAISVTCPNKDLWFYYASPDGSIIRPLTDSPISSISSDNAVTSINWSSGDQFIAVTQVSPAKSSLYILNVENSASQPVEIVISESEFITTPSWQPITRNEVMEEEQTPKPTEVVAQEIFPPIGTGVSNGEWIAFIGGEMIPNPADLAAPTLNYDVHMIHPDGSGLTNLTQFPAHYHTLQWSPNGQSLLFMRENPGRNDVTIMRHFAGLETGYLEVMPIVDPDHHGYSWSPNSDKIVFASASSGNYDIYTVYADGRFDPELTQLTNDPAHDVGFVWSPDGNQIAYRRVDGENFSIMVMNADGSNQHEVARGVGEIRLHWSMDEKSIYASTVGGWPPESQNSHLECEACVPGPAVYQIDWNGPSVQQIYTEEDASKVTAWYVYDTPPNSFYFMRIRPPVFVELWGTWFRAEGNSVTEIGEMDPQHTCESASGNILNEYISPNPRFSVIANFCAFRFDLYLADREASAPEKKFIHLLQLPLETSGQGGDSATVPMLWSPDGRWLIYDGGNQSFYLLDVEQILRDPMTEPAILFKSDRNVFEFSELAWQPAP